MEAVDQINPEYGENPDQQAAEQQGILTLETNFPRLDYIKTARLAHMNLTSLAALAIALAAYDKAEPPKEHIPDPAKGKELFQTCAGCHNYTSDEKKFGPSLRTLFGRVTLRNGKPASDANVRAIILDGYDRMPSFFH